MPSARNWFGYAAVNTLARIANQEKSLDPIHLARSLQEYTLPADVALESSSAFFRDRDHQLMSTILVGEVHPPRRSFRRLHHVRDSQPIRSRSPLKRARAE